MDRLRRRDYNVKTGRKRVVRRVFGGELETRRLKAAGAAHRQIGDDAPQLICECDTIPFAHFLFQCVAERMRESADAIAHTPAGSETPVL